MEITEPRTRELLQWLDDRAGDHSLAYADIARYRDAAAVIRQQQAAEQAAWHAGLDAGREQGRGKDHAHQPPSVLVGVEELCDRLIKDWDAQGRMPKMAWDFRGFAADAVRRALAQQPAATGEDSSKDADVARPKRRPYNASGSLSEYGVFPECDAQQPAEDAEPVAYRVLRKAHDGEWKDDGRDWCSGQPSADLLADIAKRADGWRIEYAYAALSQPADGEEIMVNTPYDVYTLPLQPSRLSSGPRFVVHVPGPEQPAAVDGVHELFLCESSRLHLCPDRLYRFVVDPKCSLCAEAVSIAAMREDGWDSCEEGRAAIDLLHDHDKPKPVPR